MSDIPKPPAYWRWRTTKRLTWEAAIQHTSDSFIASDLGILTSQTVGHAMRDFCEEGYFTKKPHHEDRWKYIYSAETPFMAYKAEWIHLNKDAST